MILLALIFIITGIVAIAKGHNIDGLLCFIISVLCYIASDIEKILNIIQKK